MVYKSIEVDIETMRYLEFLHFELNGYKNIVSRLLVVPRGVVGFKIDNDTKEFYINNYIKLNTEIEMIKRNIINAYVPLEEIRNNFTFDFNDCSLKYRIGGCKC